MNELIWTPLFEKVKKKKEKKQNISEDEILFRILSLVPDNWEQTATTNGSISTLNETLDQGN